MLDGEPVQHPRPEAHNPLVQGNGCHAVRASDWLLGLASLVFLSFPVVALLGGWHGNLRLIGMVTFLGFVALALHVLLAPPVRFGVASVVALAGAALLGLLISVSFSTFLDLQGDLVLFVLGAVGTALLAMGRPPKASWYLWATAVAWLAEGLLLTFAPQTPVWFTRTLDGVAAAGLIAAFCCCVRKPSPAQSL